MHLSRSLEHKHHERESLSTTSRRKNSNESHSSKLQSSKPRFNTNSESKKLVKLTSAHSSKAPLRWSHAHFFSLILSLHPRHSPLKPFACRADACSKGQIDQLQILPILLPHENVLKVQSSSKVDLLQKCTILETLCRKALPTFGRMPLTIFKGLSTGL